GVAGGGDAGGELGVDGVGQGGRDRDEDRGGGRVVLGLTDEVDGDVGRVGLGVGDHGDLGGAGLGVDADQALDGPFGGGDVDVAGAGDHVDRVALPCAVGEHADGHGAAHGVDLVDAEQPGDGEDALVRQAAVGLLGRGGQGDGVDARDLGGDGVHDDAGGEHGEPAGGVQAHAAHGDVALGDE